MEVPRTDYNKHNQRWADRVRRENSVNAQQRSVGYECHRAPNRFQSKINNLPPPSERQRRILEYMHNKEAYDANNPIVSLDILSPRTKYYLPQSVSQELGWSLHSKSEKPHDAPRQNIMTGLYNRRRHRVGSSDFSKPVSATDHNVGFVTMLGEDSHPPKGLPRSFSLDAPRHADPDDADIESLADPLDVGDLPGDYHVLPHEWKYRLSKFSAPIEDVPLNTKPPSEHTGAVSLPSTVFRRIDSELSKCIMDQGRFLNRSTTNRWYHPLNSNDVSRYGDASVKCMHCGPFNKSQLLVSR